MAQDNGAAGKNGRKKDGTFAKGYRGGPGRPKGSVSPSTYLKRAWDECFSEKQRLEWAKRIIKDAPDKAFCLTEFMNRLDGKVADVVLSENVTRAYWPWELPDGESDSAAASDAETGGDSQEPGPVPSRLRRQTGRENGARRD